MGPEADPVLNPSCPCPAPSSMPVLPRGPGCLDKGAEHRALLYSRQPHPARACRPSRPVREGPGDPTAGGPGVQAAAGVVLHACRPPDSAGPGPGHCAQLPEVTQTQGSGRGSHRECFPSPAVRHHPLGQDKGAEGEEVRGSLPPYKCMTDPPPPCRAQQLLEVQEKGLPSSRHHRGPRSNVSLPCWAAGRAGQGLGPGAAKGGVQRGEARFPCPTALGGRGGRPPPRPFPPMWWIMTMCPADGNSRAHSTG